MSIDRMRYGRQIRLPEIGEAGQERLAAAEVVLGGKGDAREIEAAYLAGGGVGLTSVAGASVDPDAEREVLAAASAIGVRDGAARDVAEGSLRALVAMRHILGVRGGPR